MFNTKRKTASSWYRVVSTKCLTFKGVVLGYKCNTNMEIKLFSPISHVIRCNFVWANQSSVVGTQPGTNLSWIRWGSTVLITNYVLSVLRGNPLKNLRNIILEKVHVHFPIQTTLEYVRAQKGISDNCCPNIYVEPSLNRHFSSGSSIFRCPHLLWKLNMPWLVNRDSSVHNIFFKKWYGSMT